MADFPVFLAVMSPKYMLATVLGKFPVPECPTIWMIVGQGPTALAVGAGGGCFDVFTLLYPFSPLSPSLSGRRPDID